MTDTALREIARKYLFRTSIGSKDERLSSFTSPILESGSGCIVVDTQGKEYLDFNSGQMCAAFGHNHPKILKAIEESAHTLIHSNTFLLNVAQVKLLARLGEILDPPFSKVFLSQSGSDSNEVAVEMAKKYTGGYEIIAFDAGFHGFSEAARAITFSRGRRGYGPFPPGVFAIPTPYCYRCPIGLRHPGCSFACLEVGFKTFDAQSAGAGAAFIAEPILSSGGVIEVPEGYFPTLREKCSQRGMLLIFDEAQTGLGKLGTMFGYQQVEATPDIFTLSKHFGGGVPISATITSAAIEERIAQSGLIVGHSHTADPLVCTAGLASIDILLEEDMMGKARHIESSFKTRLLELQESSRIIGDVRGRGLLLGVEIVKDRKTKEPGNREAEHIMIRCMENGLLINCRGGYGNANVLRVVPPFCATDAQLDRAADILVRAIHEVESGA